MSSFRLPLGDCTAFVVGALIYLSHQLIGFADDYRKPSDLLSFSTQHRLIFASQRTGEILSFDSRSHKQMQRAKVGESIERLIPLMPDRFIAVLPKDQQIVFFWLDDGEIRETHRQLTSFSPINAIWDSDGERLYVSCLWSKRLDCFPVGLTDGKLSIGERKSIDLPIWPGAITVVDKKLLIADRFGCDACVIHPISLQIEQHRDLFGSPIRAIANVPTEKREIAVVHSVLNEYARTDRNEIHWGVLMTNDFRKIKVDRLLDPLEKNVYRDGTFHPLGIPGNGAAEPTAMAIHPQTGRIAVSIGGTNQVALGHLDSVAFHFVNVGRYPIAVSWSGDGDELYVVNQFDDSYSVIDVVARRVTKVVELGPIRSLTDAELGEQLFHSATLSHDRWMTCGSCHTDGHTNGQLADNLGDLNFGAPKRTPSLRGVKDTAPYTWMGHSQTLASQTMSSVRKTMNSYRRLDDDEIGQIVAYMESLEPVVPLAVARGNMDLEKIERGRLVFEQQNCSSCHQPERYTSFGVYDVGVQDENKGKLFNPPSLRGVSQRGQYFFHDNRARGLRSVFEEQKHQLDAPLTEEELSDLISFLESL